MKEKGIGTASKLFALMGIIALVIVLFLVVREANEGSPNENVNTTDPVEQTQVEQSPDFPAEPTNPETTGGSSGVGTGESNTNSTETPSPAGGVDTNNSITP